METSKGNVGAAGRGRILSIDILRGIAVIGMVLVHFALMFFIIGFIGGPAPANCGMGCMAYLNYVHPILVCFVAPLFVMTSGMAVSLSVHRRRARGVKESKTLRHEVIRFILLMLVGFAFSFHLSSWIGGVNWQGVFAWSILQNLALAGLVAYFLSKTKIRYQLLTAAIIFIITPFLQIATGVYGLAGEYGPFSPELLELAASSPALHYLFMTFVGPDTPIFPWIGFGAVGCVLGSLLARKDFAKSIPYQFLFGIALLLISSIPTLLEVAGIAITNPVFLGIKQRYPSSIGFVLGATGINLLLSSVVFFLDRRFDLSSGRLRHLSNYFVTCGKTALMIWVVHFTLCMRFCVGIFDVGGAFNFVQVLAITVIYLIFQCFLSLGWLDFVSRRKFRYFELCFWIGYCALAELMLIGVGL